MSRILVSLDGWDVGLEEMKREKRGEMRWQMVHI